MRMDHPGRRSLTVSLWVLASGIVGMLLWVSVLADKG